ncbi:hypothetical protein BDZ89DRAFT_1079436 [Hymenopellis radicata]|nr:hypothetical protein BDZ89DRAFT_1079436 [Hymenopellis radicata]
MNLYPSLPISAERTLEYHPFHQRVKSDPQSEAEENSEDMDSDSDSEPEDHPLPADAARWISMSPAQFDREYPGGNPFVFEELNWDSEEDPESASYVELDGARALHRIFVIFWAVDPHREIIWSVLADLLKDGKVWLWVDGDEEKCADLDQVSIYLKESLKYTKRKLSCSSLRLRKPRLPTWSSIQERVSKASFAMRVSAITWATFTSVPVREAGWVRGLADWTRCAPLSAARTWRSDVLDDLGILNLLVRESWHSHVEVAFKDILRCHGHSCDSSPEYSEESLQLLLYLQSFLRSTPSGKDVSMILFVEDWSCQQCAKLKELYIANNDAPGHIPQLSLLVLNELRLDLEIDTTAWLRILVLGVSRGIISAAILTKMDGEIQTHLGTNHFDSYYQPWVNRILRSLRHSVVICSESEWREAELAVRRENQHQSVLTSRWDSPDIGLGVRITAIYMLMLEHSSQKLTPRKYWIHCYRCGMRDEMFDDPVYPPDVSALVEAFCDVTSESPGVSTHTCCEYKWSKHSLKLRQCYAAAYLLLYPDIPLLEPLRRPVACEFCDFYEDKCLTCERCRQLPEEPLVPSTQITASDATIPPADGTDDSVPTSAVVRPNSPLSISASQIPSTSGQSRASTLPKDVILPKLKTHFAKLLAQHNIPSQYTNLGEPQLPWCTLPRMLKNRRLEIAGWPKDLPLPDATGKHNAKGIIGLTAKDARCLHEALPGISFRRMDKARARPREEENEDDIANRPTKKVKGKAKAPAEGEKKFRVSEVQKVIRGIHVGKYT